MMLIIVYGLSGSFSTLGLARGLFLDDVFVEAVDDGHREEDTGSRSDGSQEVGKNSEQASENTTEQGCSFDNLLQFLVGANVSVPFDGHSLFFQTVSNFPGTLPGNRNPGLAEKSAAYIDK